MIITVDMILFTDSTNSAILASSLSDHLEKINSELLMIV